MLNLPANLDLNLLRCFQAVAEAGSISKAAETIHLSQPAISLQIKRLEDQLGQQLFQRQSRGLQLTTVGRRLIEHTRQIAEQVQAMQDFIERADNDVSGRIKIGTGPSISAHLLPDAAASFLQTYPDATLSFVYGDNIDLLNKVKALEVDCAILSDIDEEAGFTMTSFFSDELVLVTAKDSPLVRRRKIDKSTLAKMNFIACTERTELCYRRVTRRFARLLSEARVPIEAGNYETLKQMLLRGVGTTFLPRHMVKDELEAGTLAELPVNLGRLNLNFYFVTRKNLQLNHATKTLKKYLVRYFSE